MLQSGTPAELWRFVGVTAELKRKGPRCALLQRKGKMFWVGRLTGPALVHFAEDVKHEVVDIKVERLVVQE